MEAGNWYEIKAAQLVSQLPTSDLAVVQPVTGWKTFHPQRCTYRDWNRVRVYICRYLLPDKMLTAYIGTADDFACIELIRCSSPCPDAPFIFLFLCNGFGKWYEKHLSLLVCRGISSHCCSLSNQRAGLLIWASGYLTAMRCVFAVSCVGLYCCRFTTSIYGAPSNLWRQYTTFFATCGIQLTRMSVILRRPSITITHWL